MNTFSKEKSPVQPVKSPVQYILVLLIALYVIWIPEYFVTGDGACHVHNAIAWREMVLHSNTFYAKYYTLNTAWSPNYLSHVLLAIFTLFLKPVLAEKVFLSLVILLFVRGFSRCAEQLPSANTLMYPVLLVLLFSTFLLQGFYNFLFGTAIYFMLLAWYLKHKENMKPHLWFRWILGLLLLYFTHLFGLFLLLGSIALITLNTYVVQRSTSSFLQRSAALLLSASPVLLLTALYIFNQPPTEEMNYLSTENLKEMLRYGSELQLFSEKEKKPVSLIIAGLALIALYGFIRQVYTFKKYKSRFWLLVLSLLLIIAYFQLPESVLGGEQVKQRLQWLLYCIVLLYISLFELPRWLQYPLVLCAWALAAMLLISRQPAFRESAQVVHDIVSAGRSIATQRTVLPLCFEKKGYVSGKNIALRSIHGNHLGNYLQNQKELIFLDNYEANTTYFPLRWVEGKNPFQRSGEMEAPTPWINLSDWNKAFSVDYILLFNVKEEDKGSNNYLKLLNDMRGNYTASYYNSDSSVMLFERVVKN